MAIRLLHRQNGDLKRVFLALLLAIAGVAAGEINERFEALIQQAEAYDDDRGAPEDRANRDLAVSYYRQALAARPDHPDNIKIEFHIILLLMQSDPNSNGHPRDEDACAAVLDFLDKYKQEDYYDLDPPRSAFAPSSLVANAADTAGELVWIVHGDPVKARKYFAQAIEDFANICRWRAEDYAQLEEPDLQAMLDEADRVGEPIEKAQRSYEELLEQHQKRKQRLAENKLLGDKREKPGAEGSISRYSQTFKDPEERIAALEEIAKKYGDTELASMAQVVIEEERAKQAALPKKAMVGFLNRARDYAEAVAAYKAEKKAKAAAASEEAAAPGIAEEAAEPLPEASPPDEALPQAAPSPHARLGKFLLPLGILMAVGVLLLSLYLTKKR